MKGDDIRACLDKIGNIFKRVLRLLIIGAPRVIFGTKCPSITSICSMSAPAFSTAIDSFPSMEKSEARIEGDILSCIMKILLASVY